MDVHRARTRARYHAACRCGKSCVRRHKDAVQIHSTAVTHISFLHPLPQPRVIHLVQKWPVVQVQQQQQALGSKMCTRIRIVQIDERWAVQ